MEDFASKEKKGIKEKSLYVLHLDTPRIIIIFSVIIGLIIISALIGLNINKQDQRDRESFAHDNPVLDNLLTDNSENPNALDNNKTEPPLNNENLLKNQENDNSYLTADNSIKPNNSQGIDNPASKEQTAKNAADILTHENIETIIPPAKIIKKHQKKSFKKSEEKHPDKTRENKKSKGVVEVSSREKTNRGHDTDKNYFSIQVASFDKRAKALAEMHNLEDKKYSAFIDSAKVNGKTFYRVMIGPIYSKKKACDLLDEISANNRYEESYIIKR